MGPWQWQNPWYVVSYVVYMSHWPIPTAASHTKWQSKVYEHYNVSVKCDNILKLIKYVFKCRYSEEIHDTHNHLQTKTGNGTTNLQKSAAECDTTWGIPHTATSPGGTSGTYTLAAHCVMIVMMSATSNHPFNAVHNKYYWMEVKILRPG